MQSNETLLLLSSLDSLKLIANNTTSACYILTLNIKKKYQKQYQSNINDLLGFFNFTFEMNRKKKYNTKLQAIQTGWFVK